MSKVMKASWIFTWYLLFVLHVQAEEKSNIYRVSSNYRIKLHQLICQGRPYEAVDSEVLQKARDFQDALIPLPSHVINYLVKTTASVYLPIRADPGLCRSHSQYTLHSVLKSEIWALRMIDASSKLPSGLLDGSIQDLGNYDQCLRVEEPEHRFTGQHCLVEARGVLPDRLDTYFKDMAWFEDLPWGYVMFSLCVPSSCDSQDIITHLNKVLEATGFNASTTNFEVYCSSNEPLQFRTMDWVTEGITTTIMFLVALSTFYESRTSGKKSELLSSFSLVSNWQDLRDTKVSHSDISCLNGLRVILAFMVMITHRVICYRLMPTFNYTSSLEIRNNPWMALLWSSNLATELFFLIAGIVRAYNFLRKRRCGGQLTIFKQYIQRYFRLTPSMAFTILCFSTLSIHNSNGPAWNRNIGIFKLQCNCHWWSNLLHVSNYIGISLPCKPETWFVAADFQLFVLSPLLLLPLHSRPKLGLLLLTGVYLLSTTIKTADSFFMLLHPELGLTEGPKGERQLSTAHTNTVYKVATFVVGVAVGYFILEVKSGRLKVTLPRRLVWLCWVLSTLFLVFTLWFSTLFMRPSYEDSPWLLAINAGLVQRLWVLGAAWIVVACTLGYGGWLGKMLSWQGFIPLARLSFGMYLTHTSLQGFLIFRKRESYNMDGIDIVVQCIADFVVSAGLATVLYLGVEAPCSRIINHLLRPRAVAAAVGTKSNGRAMNQEGNEVSEISHRKKRK